jgi:hypothetical protein
MVCSTASFLGVEVQDALGAADDEPDQAEACDQQGPDFRAEERSEGFCALDRAVHAGGEIIGGERLDVLPGEDAPFFGQFRLDRIVVVDRRRCVLGYRIDGTRGCCHDESKDGDKAQGAVHRRRIRPLTRRVKPTTRLLSAAKRVQLCREGIP